MIFDGILNVLKSVLVITLSPLTIINVGVNWFTSFDEIEKFFTIVCWLLPWSNLKPLITIVLSVISFRIVVSIAKTVKELI